MVHMLEVVCDNKGSGTMLWTPAHQLLRQHLKVWAELNTLRFFFYFSLSLSLPQALLLSHISPFFPYGMGFVKLDILDYIFPVSSPSSRVMKSYLFKS